jgi:hypothetical protein
VKEVNRMARHRLSPIGEKGREYLKKMGVIDNRYKYGPKGIVAKETGKHRHESKSSCS